MPSWLLDTKTKQKKRKHSKQYGWKKSIKLLTRQLMVSIS